MRPSPNALRNCCFLIFLAACLWVSHERLAVWQNDISLWTDVALKAPHAPRGFANLGGAYLKQNRIDDAIASFNKSLSILPNAVSYNGLGNGYAAQQRSVEAITQYTFAISLQPRVAEYYYNRGIAEFDLGRYDQAVGDYAFAIRLDARHTKAYMNRGNALDELGRTAEALRDYEAALALDPDYAAAFFNRGLVLRKIGHRDEAHKDFTFACSRGYAAACRELARD